MTVLSNTNPKARKQHRCEFCFEYIEKGVIYCNQTFTYDEGIHDWKTHTKCSEIASELQMYDNCDEGLTGDDFVENIQQEYINLQNEERGINYVAKTPCFKDQLQFVCDQKLK